MNGRIITLLAVSLSSLMLPAVAQSMSTVLRVSVPFEFVVGRTTLPPGDYELRSRGNGVLELTNEQNIKLRMAFLTMSVRSATLSDERARVVFQRYGSQQFLDQVWGYATTTGFQLPASRKSRDDVYTAKRSSADTLVIAARR